MSGMCYVSVSRKDVIVAYQDDDESPSPREVYRIRPDGRESWAPGWLKDSRQLIGDEATHHPAGSVIGRAAQMIHAARS